MKIELRYTIKWQKSVQFVVHTCNSKFSLDYRLNVLYVQFILYISQ